MKQQWNLQDMRKKAARIQEWLRIHTRRAFHVFYNDVAGRLMSGPASFLCLSGVLGVAVTLSTLYTPSYAVFVDGVEVGVVADQSVMEEAVDQVQNEGTHILGYDYRVDGPIDYRFGLSLKSQVVQTKEVKSYLYQQLDSVCEELRLYQVVVNDKPVGVVQDKEAFEVMLEDFKNQYNTPDTTDTRFVDRVGVQNVYAADQVLTVEEMEHALSTCDTSDTTYSVKKGDTFNGIAFTNDMSVQELKDLNPKVNINRLMIDDVLNVKEQVPILSVETVNDETYTEAIPCPIKEVEDNTIYKGSSKIIEKGVEGEALVNATVTYVNGLEKDRTVNSTETLREPTVTTKAVGTKPRPKTASTGHFQWPIRGRINSYFGNRYIFGRHSFHSGIDIQARYGAPIVAADGGTVTFAGYKGSYGKLVIITHDNGMKTYYAHNSSLLVSAGQKVYKGQQIAKAGSTGRSTGTHCHFEVRVNGRAVNPLSYLP